MAIGKFSFLIKIFRVLISRKMKSSVHSEEDDFVPELHRNVHPRERPDWEETLSAMVNQIFETEFIYLFLERGEGREKQEGKCH